MERWNVGILLYDGVDVLDFAGPFEVFSRVRLEPGAASRRSNESSPFHVFTVARTHATVRATEGLEVVPAHAFADAPPIDVLVVPGGLGNRVLFDDAGMLDWIRMTAASSRLVTSVCTGALLLAKAGLLDGKRATTHWASLDLLGSLGNRITVDRMARVVEDGVITSAGVAAGMDMAFQVVERLCGLEVAHETAKYIEYRRG